MENVKKPKIRIVLPNLLMIPVVSIICTLLKVTGIINSSWFDVILRLPIFIYFIWTIGFLICMLLSVLTIYIFNKLTDD